MRPQHKYDVSSYCYYYYFCYCYYCYYYFSVYNDSNDKSRLINFQPRVVKLSFYYLAQLMRLVAKLFKNGQGLNIRLFMNTQN